MLKFLGLALVAVALSGCLVIQTESHRPHTDVVQLAPGDPH